MTTMYLAAGNQPFIFWFCLLIAPQGNAMITGEALAKVCIDE